MTCARLPGLSMGTYLNWIFSFLSHLLLFLCFPLTSMYQRARLFETNLLYSLYLISAVFNISVALTPATSCTWSDITTSSTTTRRANLLGAQWDHCCKGSKFQKLTEHFSGWECIAAIGDTTVASSCSYSSWMNSNTNGLAVHIVPIRKHVQADPTVHWSSHGKLGAQVLSTRQGNDISSKVPNRCGDTDMSGVRQHRCRFRPRVANRTKVKVPWELP